MTEVILALCPSEGPERFIPQVENPYPTEDLAREAGARLIQTPSYRAFRTMALGPIYECVTHVVPRA
jgi:hypothetical protein